MQFQKLRWSDRSPTGCGCSIRTTRHTLNYLASARWVRRGGLEAAVQQFELQLTDAGVPRG